MCHADGMTVDWWWSFFPTPTPDSTTKRIYKKQYWVLLIRNKLY